MTHDVARPGTAKPQYNRRYLLGLAGAPDGNILGYIGVRLLITTDDIAGDLRVDQAGVHCVDANAVLNVFQSGRARQADHAVLGCDVRANTRIAGQRTDRCVIHDRTATLAFHLAQFVF